MATDDERREVAERLRAANGPSLMVLMDVLGVGGAHLFARLADLIEPNSHPNSHLNLGTQEVDASQVPKCDREALLALAEELANVRRWSCYTDDDLLDIAERIREACGEAVA